MLKASLCVLGSSVSIAGCSDSVVSVPPRSSSDKSNVSFSCMFQFVFECLSCRGLFSLMHDALLLFRNSCFLIDLVHDLVGEHLDVFL